MRLTRVIHEEVAGGGALAVEAVLKTVVDERNTAQNKGTEVQ